MAKFIILLFLFCVAFSNARVISKDALAYKRFLENSVNGIHTKPITPELATLQNEWERSGKFEGDIVLTEQQIEELTNAYTGGRNSILNTRLHWTNKVVVYDIAPGQFTSAQIDAIERGVAEINRVSCLNVRKRTSSDVNYILVQGTAGGCYSSVGMVGGRQVLNLQFNTPGSGCFRHGTIVHEFLHAIGFYHMQSTHNRDDWVRIVWEKIQPGTEHNFNKYTSSQVSNLGTDYDYGSVLHYSEYGFSIDGSKTIVPLKATNEIIGQRNGMSESDIIKLNKMYNCPGF